MARRAVDLAMTDEEKPDGSVAVEDRAGEPSIAGTTTRLSGDPIVLCGGAKTSSSDDAALRRAGALV